MTSYYATFALHIFEGILAAIGIGLAASPVAIKISHRFGLVDMPGSAPHKQHAHPTPLAGGIILAIALPVLAWIMGIWNSPQIRATLLAAAIVFVFGLLDDARGLRAWGKLLGQVIAASFLVASGVYIQILENPKFFLGTSGPFFRYLDFAITILWLVGITNAFNLVDSMDGLAVGLSGTAFAFFMLATLDSAQPDLSRLSSILFGLCIVLYFLNAAPARIFLGDSGAQPLGFFLAALAIMYNPIDLYQSSSWFMPVLLVGVPIFDTILVSLSRIRHGKPFYLAGLDHTYHRLVSLGLDSNRAVLVMNLASLILDSIAFLVVSLPPLYANMVFGLIILVGIVLIGWLDSKRVWEKYERLAIT